MAPARTSAVERPWLKLDRRTGAIEQEIAKLNRRIEPTPTLSGELMEIEGPSLMLFRFATPDSHRPVIIDIPRDLCSPAVRGKLFDLLVAIEREEVTRADRCFAAAGPGILQGV